MTQTPANYQVGHRKPPKQTQFKKGQSGNPGGKPGLAKSATARFKQALKAALEMNRVSLSATIAETTLESVANRIVLSATSGGAAETRLLLSLIENLESGEDAAAAERQAETRDGTGTNSLTQGESQGDFRYYGASGGRK